MGDMGDLYRDMKETTKAHRQRMLEQADTEGWTRHTEHHYSRMFSGKRMEWWPSGGKAKFDGRMIHTHRQVNEMISRLKRDAGE